MKPLDLGGMAAALESLDAAPGVWQAPAFEQFDGAVQRTLEAGVVQNFEFCFELATKMLKRRIDIDSEDTAVDQLAWRDPVRVGAERGLIVDPERWFLYRRMRNITSHTDDRARALEVLAVTQPFRDDAQALLQRLQDRNHG